MPELIIAETCPAPECNLTVCEIEQMVGELAKYHRRFDDAFGRVEQIKQSRIYLQGLLGDLSRKTTERIALEQGVNVRTLQYFMGQSPWPTEPVLAIHQRLVGETLGEADGVMLVDESGVVKQGAHSVGVTSQYCGAVGKVANCQVGVYLGYVSRQGYSLIDSQLFVPERWFEPDYDELRQKTGMPTKLTFQTKPQIGLDLLTQAVARDTVPFRWVAADFPLWELGCVSGRCRSLGQRVLCRSLVRYPSLVGSPLGAAPGLGAAEGRSTGPSAHSSAPSSFQSTTATG